MSGNRTVAAVIVAVLVAVLGYAFVTGLAYQYIKKAANKMATFDVQPPPPPPPPDVPPPPPPPEQPMTPPPVVTPPPIVQVPSPPVVLQSVTTPPPAYIPVPPAPPAPPPPHVDKSASVRGNPGRYFGPDAYPSSARRAGAEGRVAARLTVSTDGRVIACTVTSSSGNSALDDTTCDIAKRRVRYTPAKDQNGNPIQSTVPLAVRWQLENE